MTSDFRERMRDIARRLSSLERSARLPNAAVGSGVLRVTDGGSMWVYEPGLPITLFAGHTTIPDGSGRDQMIVQLSRDDGSTALALADFGRAPGHPHKQALVWYDREGNVVFGDDTNGGQGIARPWLSIGHWTDAAPIGELPPTAGERWTVQQLSVTFRQHPCFRVDAIVSTSDAGTEGEVGLFDPSGQQVGTPMIVPPGDVTHAALAGAWTDWTFGDGGYFTLRTRRTAGAGAVNVRGTGFYGTQSPA